ncbi:MAG: hypothetical protein LBK91_06050, partial [Synergistaceae bacterium]|nr:hypothetical protein [Synergistaceae bacterium]
DKMSRYKYAEEGFCDALCSGEWRERGFVLSHTLNAMYVLFVHISPMEDIGRIYNQIMEILRHNAVSDTSERKK